ncbi:hypothetical protein J3Q64DRAFT_1733417 [Phycomyces blakesleeanus]|uniref:Uncharacterized protein n=1 Tax=Phycomyces blakesleeanus TaxID=4837 RepID=A0ABR3B2T1_PHYBL
MRRQRLQFILHISLSTFIPKCLASPSQQDDTEPISKLPIVLMPNNNGFQRRILALLCPSIGIGVAAVSMYKAFCGDKILGIAQYKPLLRRYEKENPTTRDIDQDSLHEIRIKHRNLFRMSPSSSPLLASTSTSKRPINHYNRGDNQHLNDIDEIISIEQRSKVLQLRDRLFQDMEVEDIEIAEDDNSPYLAAFLHIIGPEKAKKTKHCLLNDSLYIGYSHDYSEDHCRVSRRTEYITVVGPGAVCINQGKLRPANARYMTVDMIDQLETAHNIDGSSYVEIIVTISQLFYTTVECMNIDGDRWVKLISIIYTAMSVLQTFSLVVLHKQTAAFSIKDDADPNANRIYFGPKREILLPHYLNGVYDILELSDVAVLSTLMGIILFMVVGVWADYSSYSIAKWFVIFWIISPLVFIAFALIVFFLSLTPYCGFLVDCTFTITFIILFICSDG